MNPKNSPVVLFLSVLLISLVSASTPEAVHFDSFRYEGKDPVFEKPLAEGEYRNPVLAGFYPDPSFCRVEDRYYLVNSTFSYFPGIPIFESTDLVNWKQIGHVMDRPSQLNTRGLRMNDGIYAPTIRYHDGIFYVICTQVGGDGNFIVTATDPVGPWSEPIWLPEIEGIDPSFFFDDDGKVYIVHNGNPPGNEPLYNGHRAIWLWEYDVEKQSVVGEGRIIVNGGVDLSKNPIWIEGPHLFKKDGWYYLNCAEGGTSWDHSQVIFRTRSLEEPFVPFPQPMITQRDLPFERPDPVSCTGHADFVETQDGEWWAVFLGTRPFDERDFLTGRETFMLPVKWIDGWPKILPAKTRVPYQVQGPSVYRDQGGKPVGEPMTGNFSWEDRFAGETLGLKWIMPRTPKEVWYELGDGPGIDLIPQDTGLDSVEGSAYLGRRQQHMHFKAAVEMMLPESGEIASGLAFYQSEKDYFFLGTQRTGEESVRVFLEKSEKGAVSMIHEIQLSARAGEAVVLKVSEQAGSSSFTVVDEEGTAHQVAESVKSSFLGSDSAGGFVGCTVGIHARIQ